MKIYMTENRIKRAAKRLRKILRERGLETHYMDCLNLVARLLGFHNYTDFSRHAVDAPISPFDENLPDADFAARDDFQMGVLAAAGYAAIAREVLDRVNPTGSWASISAEEIEG